MKAVVKINDVVLDSEGFAHVLATGTRSPRTTFVITNGVDTALAALKNPVSLTMEVGPEKQPAKKETFKNLYLRSRRRLDPWHVEWALEDQRSELEDVRVTAFFNMTYATTSVSVADAPSGGTSRFNPAAFCPHTCTVDGTDFFTPDTLDLVDKSHRPWTAKEAVVWLLTKGLDLHRARYGLSLKVEIEDRLVDNNFVLQNTVSDGRRFPDLLEELLRAANGVVWQNAAGKWVIDDPYAPAVFVPSVLGGYEGAGWVETTDLTRSAPKRMNVSFPSVHEMLLRFSEGSTTMRRGFGPQAVELENVVQLPDDVGGRKRGEWVDISTALSLWNNDGWANGDTLTLAKVRRGALSRAFGLGSFAGLSNAVFFDSKRFTRIAALISSYRRVFRINPLLLPFIRSWEPARSAIADPFSGQRVASPVWQDYAIVMNGKQEISGAASAAIAKNVEFPGRFGLTGVQDDSQLSDALTSPVQLEVIDRRQGVFEAKFNQMRDLNIVNFIPSRVTVRGGDLEANAVALAEGDALGLFDFAQYEDDFDFATIVSMTLTAPNSAANHVVFKKDMEDLLPDGQKPAGPECYELHVPDVQARFEWVPGTTQIEEEPGGFTITGEQLRNENHLRAVADGYIARAVPSFINRVMGLFAAPDYNPERDQLGGPRSEVALRLLPNGQYETRHVFPFQVPAPDILAVLLPSVRKAELGRLA